MMKKRRRDHRTLLCVLFSAFSLCLLLLLASCGTAPHVHTVEVIHGTEATCGSSGSTARVYCPECGEDLVVSEVIPAKDHVLATTPAIAPTCTANGYSAGVHCSICGAVIKAQTEIPSLGHVPDFIPGVEPTCTQGGLTQGVICMECGALLQAQTFIPPLGHTVVIDEAMAPTTLTPGLTEGSHCAVCGETIVVQAAIPPVSGTYKESGLTPEEEAMLLLDGVGEQLRVTLNDTEIIDLKKVSLETLRKKIRTVGDALAFIDSMEYDGYNWGGYQYDPVQTYDEISRGSFNSGMIDNLIGYLLVDDIPDLKIVCVTSEKHFYDPTSGLLIPYGTGWLLFSPIVYSATYIREIGEVYTEFDPQYLPVLNSPDDFAASICLPYAEQNDRLSTLFVFTPNDEQHWFNYDYENRQISCDTLQPVPFTPETDYLSETVKLLKAVEIIDAYGFGENPHDLMTLALYLKDKGLQTAADTVDTLAEALAFCLMQRFTDSSSSVSYYYDSVNDIEWRYHYDGIESSFRNKCMERSELTAILGYLLRGDYEEIGTIAYGDAWSIRWNQVSYIKTKDSYYVFDAFNMIFNYDVRSCLLFKGDTLQEAAMAYVNYWYDNEEFAVSWQAMDKDVPFGVWQSSDSNAVVLPDQYRDQLTVLCEGEPGSYEFRQIPNNLLQAMWRE